MRRLTGLAIAAALLTACAGTAPRPQSIGAPVSASDQAEAIRILQRRLATARRLYRVGERILFSGVSLCGGRVTPAIGVAVWNAHSGRRLAPSLMALAFGLGDQIEIQEVGGRSPAARAGLRAGDRLLTVGGRAVPSGVGAVAKTAALIREMNRERRSYVIEYVREGRRLRARTTPKNRCGYTYGVMRARMVNAFADGSRVVVTTGLMRFARSDAELAVVFGHELAHNTLGHVGRVRTNTVLGTVSGTAADLALGVIGIPTFGIFSQLGSRAGRAAFSVAYEKEADYVGLYFAALAGYRVGTALDIWRRLAIATPNRRGFVRTHPSYRERFQAMRRTAAEIASKRAAGRPLRPNRPVSRDTGPAVTPAEE